MWIAVWRVAGCSCAPLQSVNKAQRVKPGGARCYAPLWHIVSVPKPKVCAPSSERQRSTHKTSLRPPHPREPDRCSLASNQSPIQAPGIASQPTIMQLSQMRPMRLQQQHKTAFRSRPKQLLLSQQRPGGSSSSRRLQCSVTASAATAPWGPGSSNPTAAAIAAAVQQQPAFQLAASVIRACQQVVAAGQERLAAAFPQLQNVDKQVCACCDAAGGGRAVGCGTHRSGAAHVRQPGGGRLLLVQSCPASVAAGSARSTCSSHDNPPCCLLHPPPPLRSTGAEAAAAVALRQHARHGLPGPPPRARLPGVAVRCLRAHV
jgi:hypothetical protein